MASYDIINKLTSLPQDLLSTLDLDSLLNIENRRTFEDTIKRLLGQQILIQLEKGKYQIAGRHPSDFALAQFLYSPSYISFETALNYYGILPQFPYEITSATIKKRTTKLIQGKTFSYSHLDQSLFIGYLDQEAYLIATPEKALFDLIYLSTKGLKSLNALDEMDLGKLDKAKLLDYSRLVDAKQRSQVFNIVNKQL